jgi:hypothetical protein
MPTWLFLYEYAPLLADGGHLIRIKQTQRELFKIASAAVLVCKGPQRVNLAYWYLYIAEIPMPAGPYGPGK